MAKIIIDTNVLYTWARISPNPKLKPESIESLLESNELLITSISLIELLVKYRGDISKLKQCLSPLIHNQIKVVQVGFMPIPIDIVSKVFLAQDILEVKGILKTILDLKISKEAEFLRWFFTATAVGIIEGLLQDERSILESNTEFEKLSFYSAGLLESNSSLIFTSFENALRTGYENDDPKGEAKLAFADLMRTVIKAWLIQKHLGEHGFDLSSLGEQKQSHIDATLVTLNSDPLWKKLDHSIDNPVELFSRKRYKANLELFIDKLKQHLSGEKAISVTVLDYFVSRLEKMLFAKARMDKNDVSDLLILYSLLLNDALILTLDIDLIKFMESINHQSAAFIRKVTTGIDM